MSRGLGDVYKRQLLLPVAYRSLSRPSSAPDAKAFPLRSFALDLISCCQEGLALVLKRLNYAGSEFFEIVLCYPFRKVPQIIFVSLCCLLFILGYFVQFSRCVSSFFRNQIQTPNLLECLHPISHYRTGTRRRRDAGSPAHKRFGGAKPCRRGNSFAPRMSYPLWGSPFDGNQMGWWAQVDSNHRPHDYQSCALAS